jgi:hypothetical protein
MLKRLHQLKPLRDIGPGLKPEYGDSENIKKL